VRGARGWVRRGSRSRIGDPWTRRGGTGALIFPAGLRGRWRTCAPASSLRPTCWTASRSSALATSSRTRGALGLSQGRSITPLARRTGRRGLSVRKSGPTRSTAPTSPAYAGSGAKKAFESRARAGGCDAVPLDWFLDWYLNLPNEMGGGAGNRTLVRKRLAHASTYVADTLNRAGSRLSAGSSRSYSPVSSRLPPGDPTFGHPARLRPSEGAGGPFRRTAFSAV
jgi:hypothetical protein